MKKNQTQSKKYIDTGIKKYQQKSNISGKYTIIEKNAKQHNVFKGIDFPIKQFRLYDCVN